MSTSSVEPATLNHLHCLAGVQVCGPQQQGLKHTQRLHAQPAVSPGTEEAC